MTFAPSSLCPAQIPAANSTDALPQPDLKASPLAKKAVWVVQGKIFAEGEFKGTKEQSDGISSENLGD